MSNFIWTFDDEKLEIMALEKKILDLQKTVDNLQSLVENAPYGIFCALKDSWDGTPSNSIITYDKFTKVAGNIGGLGMNLTSGIFTAGHTGTWSITFNFDSVHNGDGGGTYNVVNLYRRHRYWNTGIQIEESHFEVSSKEKMTIMTGKTIYHTLYEGDDVYLKTGSVESDIERATICFELVSTYY